MVWECFCIWFELGLLCNSIIIIYSIYLLRYKSIIFVSFKVFFFICYLFVNFISCMVEIRKKLFLFEKYNCVLKFFGEYLIVDRNVLFLGIDNKIFLNEN